MANNPQRCDCGAALTSCHDCAVGDYQAAHPACEDCCPPRHRAQGDPAAAINIQPTTVEQASQALFDLTVMSQWENWIPARDTLIAAVRAEEAK